MGSAWQGTGPGPQSQTGVAGGVVNTALELGPAIGLALLASLAAGHTGRLGGAGLTAMVATTRGYTFALTTSALVFSFAALLAAVVIGTDHVSGDPIPGATDSIPTPIGEAP